MAMEISAGGPWAWKSTFRMAMLSRTSRAAPLASRQTAAPKSVRAVVVRASSKETPRILEQMKPIGVAAIANLIMAAPSFAEAGKIFDFNLTLPVMAGEFLILMVFLEKFWFTPVGKVLDDRDALIREKLGSVKDNTGDVEKYAIEAAEILKAARNETTAMINDKKNSKQAELDKLYNEAKGKVQGEVDSAIALLDKESATVLKNLDAQVDKISSEVLKRVLPAGVKI